MTFLSHNFFDEYPHKQELVLLILLAFVSFTIYQIVPNLDLIVSDYFYNFDTNSWLIDEEKNPVANIHNKIFGKYLHIILGGFFSAIFVYSFFDKDIKTKRNKLLFYLIALGLSPVIFTAISKYYFDRPRPYIIQHYNQQTITQNEHNQNTKHIFEYVPPFEKSQQCKVYDCSERDTKSFFSGHISRVASYIIFIWFLSGFARLITYHIFYAFLILAIFMRLSTGNHYLSDCLVGFYITYFSIWLMHYIFYKLDIKIK